MSTDVRGRGHAPAGVRTGGQYTAQRRAEPGTTLISPTRDLNDAMELNHAVQVQSDGGVVDGPDGVYAPDLYVHLDEAGQEPGGADDDLRQQARAQGWELMSGYTGQYGYRGPVMHASEVIGGRLQGDVLATPGLYVAVPVEVAPWGEADTEPAGWAVARRVD